MTQYQVTWWNSLPSLVVAKAGEESVKVQLASRLQEAIDEAAMRMGAIDADAYMNGWRKDAWVDADGEPADVAAKVASDLEAEFSEEAVLKILDGIDGTGA